MSIKRSYTPDEVSEFQDPTLPDNPTSWTYSDYRHELLWATAYLPHRLTPPIAPKQPLTAIAGGPVKEHFDDEPTPITLAEAADRLESRLATFDESARPTLQEGDGPDPDQQKRAEQRLLRLLQALQMVDGTDYRWYDGYTDVGNCVENKLALGVYPIAPSTSAIVAEYQLVAPTSLHYKRVATFTRDVEQRIDKLRQELPNEYERTDRPTPSE